MITLDTEADLDRLMAMMDLTHQAAFLVTAHADGRFSFAKINAAHEEQSGISAALLEGFVVGDVLPPRLADTVTANYRRCLTERNRIVYEEMLDLSGGPRWWLTTLRPVQDSGGDVIAILGQATDITELKEQQFRAATLEAMTARLNADLQAMASAAAHDAIAPMRTALETLHGLREVSELVPAKRRVDRGIAATEQALERMASLAGQIDAIAPAEIALAQADFAHLCADVVALADPDGLLAVEYRECRIRADLPLLQLLLRRLIGQAAAHAATRLRIDCAAVDGGIAVTVADDGPLDAQGQRRDGSAVLPNRSTPFTENDLVAPILLVESRGGQVRRCQPSQDMATAIRADIMGAEITGAHGGMRDAGHSRLADAAASAAQPASRQRLTIG